MFDMDGVLVDGEPLHFETVNELLGREGKSISLEQYKPYMGTKTGWADMIEDFQLSQPREHYSPIYRDLVLARYRERSEALPGALSVVTALRLSGQRLAVASSSIRPWVEACLDKIGLGSAFELLITGSEIENGKPDPEIYLLAAERLGVDPKACLAFEDAPAGIESARAAGMTVWAVRTEYTRGLALPGPDREFESLADVDITDILGVAA
ncbi:HAD family phosphatase [Candidatus Amarobacter glycogenicus]|uniref:HAD family hydrolase n=1 Tax=Candidatus Amarobacter glycogenicus TaxID=3140699 RepID=UPI0031CC8452